MSTVDFSPDDSVHVHEEGAIRLICSQFRSHEDGLPEWIKNSSDMYRRTEASPDDSVILVLLKDGRRGHPAVVGCLDFGGMTTADIERKFRNWADPEAARSDGAVVEGGHGNGGKCYMTQLFESHSYLHTLHAGRGNRYGFRGGSAVPGYFPSRTEGRGYSIEDADAELNAALEPFVLRISDLPHAAQAAWATRKGFTLVLGVGAKALTRARIPSAKWIENLQGHQQMVQSIQRNRIFVMHNGRILPDEAPLALPLIEPIPGAEVSRIVPVPAELPDPDSGEAIPTGAMEGVSTLELRTSHVSMRWSLKARHTISGWTHDGRSTGYWEVPSLSRAGYANQIYGEIRLDALAEYKQNDRRNHSQAPLTRAVQQWISERIEEYAAEFAKIDRLQATQEEQAELSRLNEALNAWKNRFLEKNFGGAGSGAREGTEGEKPAPRQQLPRGEPARLVLALSHAQAGQGVTFKPNLQFFDAKGDRIRTVAYRWESTDWAVATIDSDLNMITTHAPGVTTLSAVCKDSGLRSNFVTLEVLNIKSIELAPAEIEVSAGGRYPLIATVHTKDGRQSQGVYLVWTEDNTSVVSVGASGMVFALLPGSSSVIAGDNQVMSDTPTRVTVTTVNEKQDGGGFPRVLLSEIDVDPFGEKPPIFSSAEPPVHQRPQDVDHNIWWINMASPLARYYYKSGARSKEWRVYHLERYIEVMVKINLHYDFLHGEEVSFETVLRKWEEESIEMQRSAAESLGAFLEGGDIADLKQAA